MKNVSNMLTHISTQSERRDSNSRPRPWQGRALPAELLSHSISPLICEAVANILLFTFKGQKNMSNISHLDKKDGYNPSSSHIYSAQPRYPDLYITYYLYTQANIIFIILLDYFHTFVINPIMYEAYHRPSRS